MRRAAATALLPGRLGRGLENLDSEEDFICDAGRRALRVYSDYNQSGYTIRSQLLYVRRMQDRDNNLK